MRSFGLNVSSEGFSQTNTVIWIELDQGKGIWGIIWLYMWTFKHFSVRSETKGFLEGPERRGPQISEYIISSSTLWKRMKMLSPNHGPAGRTATAIPSGSTYLIRWLGVFVCFGFCLFVLDYSKKEGPLILLIFFSLPGVNLVYLWFRFNSNLFIYFCWLFFVCLFWWLTCHIGFLSLLLVFRRIFYHKWGVTNNVSFWSAALPLSRRDWLDWPHHTIAEFLTPCIRVTLRTQLNRSFLGSAPESLLH